MKRSEKSLCAKRAVSASSPGKIFLCGEHAVVSGFPGLLASISRRVTVNLSHSTRSALWIGERKQPFGRAQLSSLRQRETKARDRFAKTGDPSALSIFKQDPSLFLMSLLAKHAPQETPLLCSLQSNLPYGAGLGSSAAIATATIGACWRLKGEKVRRRALFDAVQHAEVLQHGTPSGADAHACIYGKIFLYRKKPFLVQRLPLSFPFAAGILHTGKPKNSTAEVVAFVQRERRKDDCFRQMANAQEKILSSLARASFPSFRKALQQAHRALQGLHVSTSLVDSVVRRVQKKGVAAKLCGAGTIQGEEGGAILLVHTDKACLKKAAALFPFPFFPVRLGCAGMRVA